jgi:phosphoribosyl 1,2-cyclic phosphodiesterase
MKFAVLGSGSRGNAVAFHSHGATLLVDAGFGPKALAKRAAQAGIPLTPLVGIVVTHEHGDHARGAATLAAAHGCRLYASAGTLARVRTAEGETQLLPPYGQAMAIGPFRITAARTAHDASESVAIAIADDADRKVGIAYDLGRATTAVRHLLRDCSALVLEANHDEVMLREGPYPPTVQARIAGSFGHLSNRAAAELAAEVCSPRLEVVVLVHVSERCNDAGLARRTVGRALRAQRFHGRLLVAAQDEPLPAVTLRRAVQLVLSFREGLPVPSVVPPAPAPIPESSG